MDFIWSTPPKPTYATGLVWRALKTTLGMEDGFCYHDYPMFSIDKSRRAPDILLFHRHWGLYVIECKTWRIEDIKNIDDIIWFINDSTHLEKPYAQLEDQLTIILSKFMPERELRRTRSVTVIEGHPFLALPHIYRSQWKERQFDKHLNGPNTIIFADDLKPEVLRVCLQHIPEDERQEPISDKQWEIARSILTGTPVLRRELRPEPQKTNTKAAFLRQVEDRIQMIDLEQQKVGMQIPDGPQRIRGIAGSGKTVVMCMKAAIMHHKHPEWVIAYTFYTRSLHAQIKSLITRFYRYFAVDAEQNVPNWNKLCILHGWGGRNAPGLYSLISKELNREPLTYQEAKDNFHFKEQSELLGKCCRELLRSAKKIPLTFDAILIDEAQDFHFDYYKLCYSALKEPKRLIWAYDEVQSLESLSIPTTIDIFGQYSDGSPIVNLEGTYSSEGVPPEEETEKDLILNRCYRNPRPVIVTAHMFGMGLQRSKGAVQFIPTQGGWEDIGYEIIDGVFEPGQKVTIRRPKENSPHKLEELVGYKDLVKWRTFDNRNQELDWIVQQIKNNIQQDELKPEEIAVISLDWKNMRENFLQLEKRLGTFGVQVVITGKNGEKDSFQEPGKITLTSIFRAKGNEASVVYVMGFEQVDSTPSVIVQDRNQAFTAMTRSRGWCILTGVGAKANTLFTEIENILSSNPEQITFTVPDPKTIQRHLDSLEYERRRNKMKKAKDLRKKLLSELAGLDDEKLLTETIQMLSEIDIKGKK